MADLETGALKTVMFLSTNPDDHVQWTQQNRVFADQLQISSHFSIVYYSLVRESAILIKSCIRRIRCNHCLFVVALLWLVWCLFSSWLDTLRTWTYCLPLYYYYVESLYSHYSDRCHEGKSPLLISSVCWLQHVHERHAAGRVPNVLIVLPYFLDTGSF